MYIKFEALGNIDSCEILCANSCTSVFVCCMTGIWKVNVFCVRIYGPVHVRIKQDKTAIVCFVKVLLKWATTSCQGLFSLLCKIKVCLLLMCTWRFCSWQQQWTLYLDISAFIYRCIKTPSWPCPFGLCTVALKSIYLPGRSRKRGGGSSYINKSWAC